MPTPARRCTPALPEAHQPGRRLLHGAVLLTAAWLLAACAVTSADAGPVAVPVETAAHAQAGSTPTTAHTRELASYLPTAAMLPRGFVGQAVTALLPFEVASLWPDGFAARVHLDALGLLETQQLSAWLDPALASPVAADTGPAAATEVDSGTRISTGTGTGRLDALTVLAMRWETERGAADSITRHVQALLTSPFSSMQAVDDAQLPAGVVAVAGRLDAGAQPLYVCYVWRRYASVTVLYSGYSLVEPATVALLQVASAGLPDADATAPARP